MTTITIGSILVWSMLIYNRCTQNMVITIGTLIIYSELGHGLYCGNKLNGLDLAILGLLILFLYISVFISSLYISYLSLPLLGLILLGKDKYKIFIYFNVFTLWILPFIYLFNEYLLTDPYIFIRNATIIWFSDGGAYIFGKLFGKTKLAPTISPNKTIEGLLGGIFLSVLVGHIIYYNHVRHIDYLILSFIYGLTGQIGDLIESMFKRWVNIKDSGFILPGIGGINDRCDSIYLAIPIGHCYMMLRYM